MSTTRRTFLKELGMLSAAMMVPGMDKTLGASAQTSQTSQTAAGTLTLPVQSASDQWDVIVIGGGRADAQPPSPRRARVQRY